MKHCTLVKYDYDKFPSDWKEENPNIYEGMSFLYLGEVPNMKGHSYVLSMDSGIPLIFHTENLIEISDDEVFFDINLDKE